MCVCHKQLLLEDLYSLSTPRLKREGRIVSVTVFNHVVFSPGNKAFCLLSFTLTPSPSLPHSPSPKGSTPNTSNMVAQLKFLEKQLARLKDPATADLVTSDLCRVRDILTSPGNLRVFMATDIDKLTSPLKPWGMFMQRAKSERYYVTLHFSVFNYDGRVPVPSIELILSQSCNACLPVFRHSPPSPLPPILPPSHCLSDSAAGKTLVVGVGGVESNFLIQSVPCVRSHDHPDYPAILVFIEYLTALEVRSSCLELHLNKFLPSKFNLLANNIAGDI